MKNIIALLITILFFNTGNAEMTTDKKQETAVFAGGCFWCMEKPFDQLNGVISTISGYTGGNIQNPTYNQVSSGVTGHIESLQIIYDPSEVDYTTLLKTFWLNIDPLDGSGQFCDKGQQYTSAIFYQKNLWKKLQKN
jgi:peptide-methionine (S)-S-oxide reductase